MSSFYEKHLLPKCLNFLCSAKPIARQREKIVPLAGGTVLELGVGSGLNFPFYDPTKIDKIIGLDPSEELSTMARRVAKEQNLQVEFLNGYAEEICLPDSSVDTVLVTYTLCTVSDALKVCQEALRVLNKGGQMLFCEHGLAPDESVCRWQNRINPIWGKLAGGCNLNRDISFVISESGFEIKSLETMYLPKTPRFAGYNYWGSAVPKNTD
ncbi:MAG: class I SAM-dependent methyltransferase [Cellvibrionales bacterium TMED148]|nr:SAM-dependent methyltransferase [Porticoccaceae bacterium]RPG92566.1 MAG: class I SAM-dependent methyltransferase [Cellvibrionales bacterium TMED148]